MKKIIDDKGRIFGLISIIDILIIIVVIVLTAGIYCRYFVLDKTAVNVDYDTITYTVAIEESRIFIGDNIKPGDKLFEGQNGVEIGTVTGVDIMPAEVLSEDIDGNCVRVPSEDRYRVEMTVEGNGNIENGKYFINHTYELNAGYQSEMFTKYTSFIGTITNIEQ